MYGFVLLAVVILMQGCSTANWPGFETQPQQTVEARRFVLLDANGKAIAELGAAQGGSGLVLMDAAGKPRAALVVTQSGEPGLKLYDRGGVVRAALIVADDGRSGLVLYDTSTHNRAALLTNRDGAPALLLFDRDGRPLPTAPANATRGQPAPAPSG